MIEAAAHFIWFGESFPWVHLLALRSAARAGGFDEVVLHHTDPLDASPWWPEVEAEAGVTAAPLDPEALLGTAGERGGQLVDVFRELSEPAGRANMVRAALLWHRGGVYLDMDTVTVASLAPLRAQADVFCGQERIVLPGRIAHSRNPLVLARAGLQSGARDLCRRLPGGWRLFRRLEPLYHAAVNNAVLGCRAGADFAGELLERMATMPADRRRVRFALGTHLLQEVVADWNGGDLVVHPPPVFFPVGPEVSQHWFRPGTRGDTGAMLQAGTRVVHWYASVRTKGLVEHIDPESLRGRFADTAFAGLAEPFVA